MKKQYAALPYRIENQRMEVLLITTRKKRRWSVPKGWPMKGRSPHRAAAIEAFEEAGVIGDVARRKISQFKHKKRRGLKPIECNVDVFPLVVRSKLDHWPEKHQRIRRWFASDEAIGRVRKKGLRRAISNVLTLNLFFAPIRK